MIQKIKKLLTCAFALMFCVLAYAQHSTSSPYSTIGIGEIDSKIYSLNSGMANSGIGLHKSGFLNNTNPAALSVDSTAFIFDISLAGNFSQYSSSGLNESAKNVNVKKVAFGVRTFHNLAISAGILPYSNVQYKIQTTSDVEGGNNERYTIYHEGSGGLSKVYLAGSYKLLPNLYLGANGSYLFGRINASETLSNLSIQTATEVDKILFDFGLIYKKEINNFNTISAGMVYGYESKIKLKNYKTVSSVGTTETKTSTYTSLPQNAGVGFAIQNTKGHSYRLFSIDYKFHNWANIKSPDQRMRYADNHRINSGIGYVPNIRTPKNYFQRIQYQLGAYYEKSNMVINGNRLSEMGATGGIILPLRSSYTQIFLSADYGRKSGDGLIRENFFRINFGVSLNQTWFMKWEYH